MIIHCQLSSTIWINRWLQVPIRHQFLSCKQGWSCQAQSLFGSPSLGNMEETKPQVEIQKWCEKLSRYCLAKKKAQLNPRQNASFGANSKPQSCILIPLIQVALPRGNQTWQAIRNAPSMEIYSWENHLQTDDFPPMFADTGSEIETSLKFKCWKTSVVSNSWSLSQYAKVKGWVQVQCRWQESIL